jgi:hypothetical protein
MSRYDVLAASTGAPDWRKFLMRIESARDLKAEVLTDVLGNGAAQPGTLAVGIAPGRAHGEFQIAVRMTNDSDTNKHIVSEIIKRAAHEVDIKIAERVVTIDREPSVAVSPMLMVGSPVAHYRSTAGTLGFFARRMRDGATGFVSCNHVIADQDRGVEGDDIVHASFTGSENKVRRVVAFLDGEYPRLRQPNVYVDCAFARFSESVGYEPSSLGAEGHLRAEVATPMEATVVEKIGRTTNRTVGRITAFDLDGIEIQYRFGYAILNGQIEIESATDSPFSRPGDSGSLVFTPDHRPLGLICASTRAGGATNLGLTFASPISSVLSALGVELL